MTGLPEDAGGARPTNKNKWWGSQLGGPAFFSSSSGNLSEPDKRPAAAHLQNAVLPSFLHVVNPLYASHRLCDVRHTV